MINSAHLRTVVETTFEVVRDRSFGDELVIICPVPGCSDKTGNRAINIKTGLTSCFRCNVGGLFFKWAKKLGYDVDPGSASVSSTDDIAKMLKADRTQTIMPVVSGCELPPHCHRVADNLNSAYTRLIEKMAISKRLTLEDMVEADVHFSRINDDWEDYAIFPVKEWDRLVIYQGRLFRESFKPGKRFPSRKDVAYGASFWVYNIDEARKKKASTVIVVESILNVLSLRKRLREAGVDDVVPVCVFKHSISKSQAAKLLSLSDLKEICIMYDADATMSAWKEAEKFVNQLWCTVAVINPVLSPTQDANDDVDAACEAFLKRKEAGMSSRLLARL